MQLVLGTDRAENTTSNSSPIAVCTPYLAMAVVLLRAYTGVA
jgi:hypothetical protein